MPMVHNLDLLPSGIVLDGTEDFWFDKFVSGEWMTFRCSLAEIVALAGGVQLTNVNVFTKNQSVEPVALVDGANIATDASLSNNFEVALGGNRTFDAPTGATDGMVCNWAIAQDGTGGRTGAFASAFDFGDAGAPTLSTGPGVVDLVSGYYHAGTSKFLCAFRKGA